jgi:hypothetical protein
MSLTAYQHSNFGSGFKIAQLNMFVFDQKMPSTALPKVKSPTGAVVMVLCIANHIIGFLGYWSSDFATSILYRIKCPIYASHTRSMMQHKLKFLEESREKKHKKEELPSLKARAGEGANHPNQQFKWKLTCVEAKKQKHYVQEAEKRVKKRANGPHLCKARCQSTRKAVMFLLLLRKLMRTPSALTKPDVLASSIGKKARIHTTSQKRCLLTCWNCSILAEMEPKGN